MLDFQSALKSLLSALHADPDLVSQISRHFKARDDHTALKLACWLALATIVLLLLKLDILVLFVLAFGYKLFEAWMDRTTLDHLTPEQALQTYMDVMGNEHRSMPLAQFLDPATQQREHEKTDKLVLKNRLMLALLIAMLIGCLALFAVHVGNQFYINDAFSSKTAASSTPAPAYIAADGQVTLYNWDGEVVDGKLVLPSEVEGLPVTAIGKLAFSTRSDIRCVEIPEGVVRIDSGAFKGCSSLQQVVLPQSLQKIGAEVFAQCTALPSCAVPEGVLEIGASAFQGCTSLREVQLPRMLNKVSAYTFSGCSSLESVQMPALMPDGKISERAFQNCTSLSSIRIPDGVIRISARAFYSCSSLSSVEIPMTLREIGSSAFRSCSNLRQIDIPASCTVNERAFKSSPTSIRKK